MDVATLAELLRETAERHGDFEKTHAEHHWWDWYAPYMVARQQGSSPEEAAAAAARYTAAVSKRRPAFHSEVMNLFNGTLIEE
jgi:hypothetical protein